MKSTRRPRRSATQWQRLVSQQATSGLTALAFCERHDLSYASFIQWRRRLQSIEPPADTEPTAVADRSLEVPSMPFIELTGPSAPGALCTNAERWLIELDLGGGIQLRIAQPR
jgi:hypothetical protein